MAAPDDNPRPGPGRPRVTGLWDRLTSASPRARLARGSALMLAGVGIQQAVALVTSIAAARILGAAGFGELGLVRTTTATFVLVAASQFGLTASRYAAELRTDDPARAGRVLGLLFNTGLIAGGAATALFFLVASPVARDVAQAPQLAGPLALGSTMILLNVISIVQMGSLIGFEAYRPAAMQTVVEGALTAVGTVSGAMTGGVLGAVGGMVLAMAISCLSKGRALSRACQTAGVSIRHRGVAQERRVLWSFLLPAWMYGATTQPFEWLSRLLLARGPGGLIDVGIFSAAYAWGQVLLVVPGQISRAAMPILTERYVAGNRSAFGRLLRESVTASVLFAVLGAVPVLACSSWIMQAYGSAFSTGAAVLAIVAVSSAIRSGSLALHLALLATGRAWQEAAIGVIWGVALLAVVIFGGGDAITLAWAHVAAAILVAVLQALLMARVQRQQPQHPGGAGAPGI